MESIFLKKQSNTQEDPRTQSPEAHAGELITTLYELHRRTYIKTREPILLHLK